MYIYKAKIILQRVSGYIRNYKKMTTMHFNGGCEQKIKTGKLLVLKPSSGVGMACGR